MPLCVRRLCTAKTSLSIYSIIHITPTVSVVDDLIQLSEVDVSKYKKDCRHENILLDLCRIYVPVCASDNLTYTNECKLRCANQYRKEQYTVKRFGPCVEGE